MVAKESLRPAAKSRSFLSCWVWKLVLSFGQTFHLPSRNTCQGVMSKTFSSSGVSRWAFWAVKGSTKELLHKTFLSMMHRWLNLKLVSCHMVGSLLFKRCITFPSLSEAWCHFLSRLQWKCFNPLHSRNRKLPSRQCFFFMPGFPLMFSTKLS